VRFSVLALDYDGTIATDGVLDPEVRHAIADVRAHGTTVVIVTGRILDDLRRFAGDLRFVDAVVAENGACHLVSRERGDRREGDYSGLETLPGLVVLGGSADGPSPRELRVALRYPDVNVVLYLSRMRHAKKWSYIRALLPALAELRRRTCVPHSILLDEAHYFLHEAASLNCSISS
jgi:hypothetical protein